MPTTPPSSEAIAAALALREQYTARIQPWEEEEFREVVWEEGGGAKGIAAALALREQYTARIQPWEEEEFREVVWEEQQLIDERNPLGIHVSVTGVDRLAKAFDNLEPIARKTILPQATAASAERLKQHIVRNIPVGPRGHKGDTGGWRKQQQRIPVAPLPRRSGFTGSALPLPTRAALGVSEDDPVFYPYIVEFGSERITETVAPIRTAVNARGEREFIQMGKVIGTGLEGLAQAMAGGRSEKTKWWHLIRPQTLPTDF